MEKKLRFRFYSLVLLALSFLFNGKSFAQGQFGRYLGVVKHSQVAQDQLAKLDFMVASQNSSEFKLVAFLTLYFGDYSSSEYITYHFDSVTYNVITGTLVFDQADQELTLVVERFGNGQLQGQLRSISSGNIGVIEMSKESSVTPGRELIQPLWGEYRGVCEEGLKNLQIQTHRSTEDSSRMGNPFGSYDVTAQVGELDPRACLESSALCVARVYNFGSYNFFKGSLDLIGRSDNLSCEVTPEGLSCNGCSLKRISKERVISNEPKTFPTYSKPEVGDSKEESHAGSTDAGSQMSGTYRGYLFHERLGVFQPASVSLVTYQGTGNGGSPALFISATSSLYFGGFHSPEYVTYRFNEREFPLLSPQIVLERFNGDVDAVLRITQIGKGKLIGEWYSILFGRVGTFELENSKDIPQVPNGGVLMPQVSSKYQGAGWNVDLKVVRESTPISSVNPFYPLNLRGAFRYQNLTRNIKVLGGSFDFYTGKFSVTLEDETLFSGLRSQENDLLLKRTPGGISRAMGAHNFQVYKRVK